MREVKNNYKQHKQIAFVHIQSLPVESLTERTGVKELGFISVNTYKMLQQEQLQDEEQQRVTV